MAGTWVDNFKNLRYLLDKGNENTEMIRDILGSLGLGTPKKVREKDAVYISFNNGVYMTLSNKYVLFSRDNPDKFNPELDIYYDLSSPESLTKETIMESYIDCVRKYISPYMNFMGREMELTWKD